MPHRLCQALHRETVLSALFALLVATSWRCAVAPEGGGLAPNQPKQFSSSDARLDEQMTGVWLGRSVCNLNPHYGMSCLGFRNISFTIIQPNDSRKAGFYRCMAGTARCRNRLDRGMIARI